MASNKQKLQFTHKLPVITVASSNLTGSTGDTVETAYTVNSAHGAGEVELTGPNAGSFGDVGGKLRLLDSNTAGTYICYATVSDDDGFRAIPVQVTAVVSAGAGLPTLTLAASAFDAFTIQTTFTNNAAYTSYQAAINSDYNGPKNLIANKRFGVLEDGASYDVQVRGVTSTNKLGPWSNLVNVKMPYSLTGVGSPLFARRAFDYIDSMGTNVHYSFQNAGSVWTPTYSATWIAFLQSLGIPHQRTSLSSSATAPSTTYTNQLYASNGFKIMVTWNKMDGATPLRPTTSGLQALLDIMAVNIGVAKINCFELWNEINAAKAGKWAGPGQGGSNPDGSLTKAEIAAVILPKVVEACDIIRADHRFDNVPVIGPSIWGRSTTTIDAIVAASPSGWDSRIDGQPIHIYTGARKPTVGGVPKDDSEGGGSTEVTLDFTIADHLRLVGGTKPAWITEMGYDGQSAPLTGGPLSSGTVTKEAMAKYELRMYLENFTRNVKKTFQYALLNNDDGVTFHGLKNQNASPPYTFNNRPVYDALLNKIALLADLGGTAATFTPTDINYTISGTGATNLLHHCLLQKSNGRWWLIVWLDEVSYNRSSTIDTSVVPNVPGFGNYAYTATINIQLDRSVTSVKQYTPYVNQTSSTLITSASLISGLVVPDHPLLLEITP